KRQRARAASFGYPWPFGRTLRYNRERGGASYRPDNIPLTSEGRFAFIDTEHSRRRRVARSRLCHIYYLEPGVPVVIARIFNWLRTARNRILRDSRDHRSAASRPRVALRIAADCDRP